MTKDDARDTCIEACHKCSEYSYQPDPKQCTHQDCPLYPTRSQSGIKNPDWKTLLTAYKAFMGK
jgi:hypothetical protein